MPTQLLTLLQYCVLAVLYLFFFRVLRAVWTEVHAPATVDAAAMAPARGRRRRRAPAAPVPVGVAAGPAAMAPAPVAAPPSRVAPTPTHLVIVEPASLQGHAVPLGPEVLLGRAATCHLVLDDSYVSSMHARLSQRGADVVLDDLGSTNGTYVNAQRVQAPTLVRPGDVIQLGSTMLELR